MKGSIWHGGRGHVPLSSYHIINILNLPYGRESEVIMGFLDTLGSIAVALGEAAAAYNNAYTDEEKMKIGEVRTILQKRGEEAAVAELDKIMESWNTYSKSSGARSLTTEDTLWEQEANIKKKLAKKMSFDTLDGFYLATSTTSDSIIIFINRSRYALRNMQPTNVADGAAMVVRNYHVQNVVKGYSRVWASEYEAVINKIADIIKK